MGCSSLKCHPARCLHASHHLGFRGSYSRLYKHSECIKWWDADQQTYPCRQGAETGVKEEWRGEGKMGRGGGRGCDVGSSEGYLGGKGEPGSNQMRCSSRSATSTAGDSLPAAQAVSCCTCCACAAAPHHGCYCLSGLCTVTVTSTNMLHNRALYIKST